MTGWIRLRNCSLVATSIGVTCETWSYAPTGWPQSRRKTFSEFSRLFQSHKLTFPSVIATKSKSAGVIPHQLQQCNRYTTALWPCQIVLTQSTAVLHEYLNEELKLLLFVAIFPEAAQNSLSFPCSEKFLSIPRFPGLRPPCTGAYTGCSAQTSFLSRRTV